MADSGQYRVRGIKWNTPVKRMCFFCLKNKFCTLIQIAAPEDVMKQADNILKNKVFREYAHAYYTCCRKCEQKGKAYLVNILSDFIIRKYEQARKP